MNAADSTAKKRIALVGQSGGPTAVINASLAGIVEACKEQDFDGILGMVNGVEGFLKGKIIDLKETVENREDLETLIDMPAMFLGSCRFKLPEIDDDGFYQSFFNALKKHEITDFFYIGGNDSMDTVDKLSAYGKKSGSDIHFVGVPKTIDNDLFGTDHSPGFGSAARFVSESIRTISYDARVYEPKSVTIVEVMGRNAGWLTAAAALPQHTLKQSLRDKHAAVDLIYLPESSFDKDSFVEDVRNLMKTRNTVIVAVSEGIKNKDGKFIDEEFSYQHQDAFGHVRHSGVGKVLEYSISEKLGVKVRSVELNVLQRCMCSLVSDTDRKEAVNCGKKAVEYSLSGNSGIMIGMKRENNNPYSISYQPVDISKVPNLEKKVPAEWIDEERHFVREEMLEYLKPLV